MRKTSPGRLAFEQLLADLLVGCANAPSASVVEEVERALHRLVHTLCYDRCTYSEFNAAGDLQVIASAARGVAALSRGPVPTEMPWLVGELRAGRIVALDHVPEDLPQEAVHERARFAAIELRSCLNIPLRVNGLVVGALSFAAFRHARAWRRSVITRLSIVGEVFASTRARARSEEEARQLRGRLWHADRVARIGALTAAIAHEINQPLSAILSNAQAALVNLEHGELHPGRMREILDAVVRDDKRAAETIRTMRAFLRREESGRERIDVAAALRDVLRLLAAEFGRQSIRVESRIETRCWVRADRTQIEQVMLNLLLNATAAMASCPPGERVLRLSARRSGDRVVVEVRDAGVGIAPELAGAVFEPFQTTRKDGLGLGLAICRSIIEAHGGAIGVDRNPDHGMTFHFDLPREAGAIEPDRTDRPASAAPVGPAVACGPLVCVIDDDAAVRESLSRLLSAEGCCVACYASGDEFLERGMAAAEIGCLLLDDRMPGMSGLELQQHLAERGVAPPVVFLSGQRDVSTGVDAMKRGAMDFLLKPVDASVLVAAVRAALARHASERGRALDHEMHQARLGRLSARERQVMGEVVRGRLNKQIAADLDIALQTVKQHRARVMEKMGVGSVAELVRVCEGSRLLAGALAATLTSLLTIGLALSDLS